MSTFCRIHLLSNQQRKATDPKIHKECIYICRSTHTIRDSTEHLDTFSDTTPTIHTPLIPILILIWVKSGCQDMISCHHKMQEHPRGQTSSQTCKSGGHHQVVQIDLDQITESLWSSFQISLPLKSARRAVGSKFNAQILNPSLGTILISFFFPC